MAKKASYYEVAHQWTFNELCDCIEIMDITDAFEREAQQISQPNVQR